MVSRATLLTDVWNTFYNHLQTGTYAISTDNIYSSMNSRLVASVGYPIVVIFPPTISYGKETVHGNVTSHEVSVLFEVFDDNVKDTKTLADEVINKILTGRSVFNAARLMSLNISETDYTTWEEGDKKIHRIGFSVLTKYMEEAL